VDRKCISRAIANNVMSTYTQGLPLGSASQRRQPLGLSVFQDMGGYTVLLEWSCGGEAPPTRVWRWLTCISAVQHRLVSLPLGPDLGGVAMR